jgi:hypothetical protein
MVVASVTARGYRPFQACSIFINVVWPPFPWSTQIYSASGSVFNVCLEMMYHSSFNKHWFHLNLCVFKNYPNWYYFSNMNRHPGMQGIQSMFRLKSVDLFTLGTLILASLSHAIPDKRAWVFVSSHSEWLRKWSKCALHSVKTREILQINEFWRGFHKPYPSFWKVLLF